MVLKYFKQMKQALERTYEVHTRVIFIITCILLCVTVLFFYTLYHRFKKIKVTDGTLPALP